MKKIILMILDGCGLSDKEKGNAFLAADPKNFNYLWNNFPHSKLIASGKEVGLPEGQMGNSEVGHLNIGAGRVVYQPLELINSKIEDKTFYENKEIEAVMQHAINNDSKLHIFGLLSDGGVHSHINHLYALMEKAKQMDLKKVYYHLFLDGRDTLPNLKEKFLNEFQSKLNEINLGQLATVSGRYYAMDRDNRWERIKLAYDAIVEANGITYPSLTEFFEANKEEGDEFVKPSVFTEEGKVESNDALLVFNFRPDRLRELFMALTNENFEEFQPKNLVNNKLVTMMPVSDEVISTAAFNSENLDNTLGTYLSRYGFKQLRIAETEKYAHVTYFFDGGVEKELKGCDRLLIPSPKIATYDLQPQMSAEEVTNSLIERMQDYDFIVLNFANGDMVGHTGVFDAAVEAIKKVDESLGKIYDKAKELGFTLMITADHGNCEEMIGDDGEVLTAHTTNPVPFIITKSDLNLKDGVLADIAVTILDLLDIPKPIEMTGTSLIYKKD